MRLATYRRRRRRARWWGGLMLLGVLAVLGQAWSEKPAAKQKSQSLYGTSPSAIRFDHTKHGSDCTQCHGAASTSRRAQDSLIPGMQVCATCHSSESKTPAKPALETCSGCHVGFSMVSSKPILKEADWKAFRPSPMFPPKASREVRFDHSTHLKLSAPTTPEQRCVSCHVASGTRRALPDMDSCMSCHNGQSAPKDCVTCHMTDPSTGKLKTHFGVKAKPQLLLPSNHGVDWKKRHGAIAKSSGAECSSCHREADCADCHTEQVAKPFVVHPPSYVTIHAIDARANQGNCTDCHTVDTFCTSCHVRANVSTKVGHTPPPRAQFHPVGWVDSTMAGNHGVMARRNIDECASCHVENDCVTCHTGINPHPPGFALNCGRLLKSNSGSCGKCHEDASVLRSLCR